MRNPLSGAQPRTFRLLSAATTNSTLVKNTPGVVHGFVLSNTSAAVKFVKLYDKASAPTVGTDTPIATFLLPATSNTVYPETETGWSFFSGIGFAVTGAVGDADTTAVAANDVLVNLVYS